MLHPIFGQLAEVELWPLLRAESVRRAIVEMDAPGLSRWPTTESPARTPAEVLGEGVRCDLLVVLERLMVVCDQVKTPGTLPDEGVLDRTCLIWTSASEHVFGHLGKWALPAAGRVQRRSTNHQQHRTIVVHNRCGVVDLDVWRQARAIHVEKLWQEPVPLGIGVEGTADHQWTMRLLAPCFSTDHEDVDGSIWANLGLHIVAHGSSDDFSLLERTHR